ncbi:MAG: SLC13 family permease [Acetobacteraceae bacterium]|nr:SLC13 family permease [Acetobacteraceae bacterium]
MSLDLALVLLMLVAATVMFVIEKPRMDAVALLIIVTMPLTGIITMNEAIAGFSDPVIVLLAALFVLGDGLVRTGVARSIGDWLYRTAGASETKLVVLLMGIVASLGAFMSSTAVVAIFIPVVLRICQNSGLAPGSLMMPLSMAALISGMMTLVATAPNLVVSSELIRQGHEGFGFFAFTPFGVPILVLAILYMLVARRFLGGGTTAEGGAARRRPSLQDWIAAYGLAEREYRVGIGAGSALIGKRLDELRGSFKGITLVALERSRRFGADTLRPLPERVLEQGDVLLLDVFEPEIDIAAVRRELNLEVLPLDPSGGYFTDRQHEIGMVEVILPAESSFIGGTVEDAMLRDTHNLAVIGLRRGRDVITSGLRRETLKLGDTLLLCGFWADITRLGAGGGDVVLLDVPAELEEVAPAASKAPHAVASLAVTVFLMAASILPTAQAALIGCLLMGLFGCVDFTSAYRSINWKSLVLIVGMLPFSIALQRTGGVELAADAVVSLVGGAGTSVVLGTLFVVTAGIGLFISNTATAVLMAPVALAMASELGASPQPFAMIVALAASTAFMTPISSPVNTLVVGPGNYRFGDFVKIGVPFSLVVLVVSVLLVPLLLPLR